MFGYVTPYKPELKIKDFETYKAYYCGLCMGIQHSLGTLPRIFLSYDVLFLCLLVDALSEENFTHFQKGRCFVHPLQPRIHAISPKLFEYGARVNTLLAYYKCLDDKMDEHSVSSFFKFHYAKFCSRSILNTHLSQSIQKDSSAQFEIEKQMPSLDAASEPFSRMLFSCLRDYQNWSEDILRILEIFSYNLGKWVYTLDAWDDLAENQKKKEYNPFLTEETISLSLWEIKEKNKERVNFVLDYTQDQLIKAFSLLPLKRHQAILENIIYVGMYQKKSEILHKEDSNQ